MSAKSEASCIKWTVLAILTVQNASVPLILRYARTAKDIAYCVPLAVVIQEILKCVFSLVLLAREKGDYAEMRRAVKEQIFDQPIDTLKLSIPAILFFTQNITMQMANTYLPSALFQVTYQGKTLVVAAMSVILLGRKLPRYKWLGIFGLAFGVSLVQLAKVATSMTKCRLPQPNLSLFPTRVGFGR
jgi:solute carrier family 35 (UDP-sugar transporter), member A1/2/3